MDVAVLYLLPARAAPVEVHLADQEPVAAGIHRDDAPIVASAARALHAAREAHHGCRSRRRPTGIRTPEDIWARGVHHLWPPVAPAEARAVHVVRRINVIDTAIA